MKLINLQALSRLSKREKAVLSFAALFLSLAFTDRLVITPIRMRLAEINQEVAACESKLSQYLRILHQKESVMEDYQKYIPYIKQAGSDEEEVATILGEIEEIARKADIHLVDIKPRLLRGVEFYKEYSVEIKAEGAMKSVVNFLHGLDSSAQLLRADNLRLHAVAQKSSELKISMTITKILIP